jgi:lysophosphatidic acid acyltransferase/lysophosphatidylinositol acyltransferase
MCIRRIPISEIPKDTEGCSNWVHDLYAQKDQIYDYFARHDTFEGSGLQRLEVPWNYYDLLIEIGWILIIGVPSIIYLFKFLWTNSFIAQIIFLILISLATIGVRAMVAVTETERGSDYGEIQKEK